MTLDVARVREVVGERFHQPPAPTYVALEKPRRIPILVSYVESAVAVPEKTLPPPVEEGFAIHVHHLPLLRAETWIDGKHASLPPVAKGGLCLFDLRTSPVARLHEGFAFTRFYLARATLDDLAYDHDLPRVGELRMPPFGQVDPVVESLALALRARELMEPVQIDSLFVDWVALAFHAHMVSTYGQSPGARPRMGELSSRRLRLASELMIARMAEPLSIAAIAAQLGMAPGHFARGFRTATGVPPHRWLMDRRIDRAKQLLRRHDLAIAEIAAVCGFSDQSHLTRVFARREKVTPASWRQRHRA